MRIALISYEFPPSVVVGGIGAYAWEAARMLVEAGHEVEVFTSGPVGLEPAEAMGVVVNRIPARDRESFPAELSASLLARHKHSPFDLLESPEIGAEGAEAARLVPEVARVVKLHTPSYLIGKLSWESPSLSQQTRFMLGALRRGRLNRLSPPEVNAESDPECGWARVADEIAAPNGSIAKIVSRDWMIPDERVSAFPLPYSPPEDLLSMDLPTNAQTVGFLGRLEARKGVVEIAEAIPRILKEAPQTKFRFLGPSWQYRRGQMTDWIQQQCKGHLESIEFRGSIGRAQLADELRACDIMLLPSRWENFPYACWESMASGRAVVGSEAGGMAEVIEHGESGLLTKPYSSHDIAAKVLSLVGNTSEVSRLGSAGRQRVVDYLAPERILPLQVESYNKALQRAKERLKKTG